MKTVSITKVSYKLRYLKTSLKSTMKEWISLKEKKMIWLKLIKNKFKIRIEFTFKKKLLRMTWCSSTNKIRNNNYRRIIIIKYLSHKRNKIWINDIFKVVWDQKRMKWKEEKCRNHCLISIKIRFIKQ